MSVNIEGAAEAVYEAGFTVKPHDTWSNLPEYWKRIYRAQARAVIDHIGGQDPSQIPGQMSLFDDHVEDAS